MPGKRLDTNFDENSQRTRIIMDLDDSKSSPMVLRRSLSFSAVSELSEGPLSSENTSPLKRREILAWVIIVLQSVMLLQNGLQSMTSAVVVSSRSIYRDRRVLQAIEHSINGKDPSYHMNKFIHASSGRGTEQKNTPYYDPPTVYPKEAGLVSRVWHSNGTPDINDGLLKGSCWCSGDDYCMCTPALAIDVILTSGPDHVWLVERSDTGQLALMGGFNEVGETVEEAARRELQEEMNVDIPEKDLVLLGVYSDPKRDKRKHAASVVFSLEVPHHVIPEAGDDAAKIHRVRLDEVDTGSMFIDHGTILLDFVQMRKEQLSKEESDKRPHKMDESNLQMGLKRSMCSG